MVGLSFIELVAEGWSDETDWCYLVSSTSSS